MLTGQAASRARDRRQRLVLPGYGRGPVLAAVEHLDRVRTAVCDRFVDGSIGTGQNLQIVAKLFWWFNQGAAVDLSVTPKPYYAADGNKAFGIAGTPDGLTARLEKELGKFPFHTFWGPIRRPGLHPLDRPIRRQRPPRRTPGPDPRLPPAPRLRPPAVRPLRLRPSLDSSASSTTRCAPLLDQAKKDREPGSGSSASTAIATSPAPSSPNRILRRAGFLERPPRPVRRDLRPLHEPGLRRLRPSTGPHLCEGPRGPRAGSGTS